MALNLNTSSTDPLYLAFRDAGPSIDLIIPAAAVYVVALAGVLMNSFVIFATLRSSSSLRGSANYLMALICACEVVHQSGHTFFLVITVSGVNFVGLLGATLFMTPMMFAANANMMAMLCAAADRLFAVASTKHKAICTRHKHAYLAGHTIVCVLFAAYSLQYTLSYALQNPGIPTTGCISEVLSGPVGFQFFICTTILNIACIACYVCIWLLIRCKNGVTKETNTRLLRSLVLIMLVSVGGYLINLSVYQFLFAYGDRLGSPVRIWQCGFIAGVLLNMGAAANAPILYMNSTEYRKAFKRELAPLARLVGLNVIGPWSSSVVGQLHSRPNNNTGGGSTSDQAAGVGSSQFGAGGLASIQMPSGGRGQL